MIVRRRSLVAAALAVACGHATLALAAGRPVSLTSLDGTPLTAQIYEASSRPSPAVVLVHMLSRTKADWDAVASDLQSAGVTALAIDLRGHGGSGGSGGALPQMADDVRAALRWLSVRPGVTPGEVGVVGASLGANLAAIAAADEASVRAVALLSPVSDYRGIRLDPSIAKKLAARQMWLAASAEDALSLRTMKDLTDSGSVPREQHVSNAVGHGMVLLAAERGLARSLVDWVRRTLLS